MNRSAAESSVLKTCENAATVHTVSGAGRRAFLWPGERQQLAPEKVKKEGCRVACPLHKGALCLALVALSLRGLLLIVEGIGAGSLGRGMVSAFHCVLNAIVPLP